ncbi:Phosphoglucosamine mutase [Methylobacterium adhaesivum]|uniref:Phosphomannomutase n=1 Tax=Methylobacterium adhaesivum TaxID=333297 RepID=A0ABT8BM22_9HYPH|nr:phosphomannomutase [Methylobacterium adhaesivum]MDN3592254.1 phosphomannomutase [Methylobacterium adhaesivum]GJD31768.1 Phosphoglucosamine mutase [Methylobacterium adhaesivum]
MDNLKFGTSGLRGLVSDLVGWPSYAYATAFLDSVAARAGGERVVLIGRDLRASSPGIAATVANAAAAAGFRAIDCGALPTPALALEGFRRGACAIMVTGSHIPQDRNGLKFYRPDGEISKTDEAAIVAALERVGKEGTVGPDVPATSDSDVVERYRRRYRAAFASTLLAGLRVAVYQQSSVARDLLVELLEGFGARAVPIGRSETFVPIDTEAHRPEDIAFIREAMTCGAFDALVTTDGDADRPLVADATGRILRGDVLGLVTARYLDAAAVVVPVTAGSAIERAGGFRRVLRTRVGSPFVIAGMEEMTRDGAGTVVGFEANGGFLLGSDITLADGTLPALPTRDAMLPILATLASARDGGLTLAALVASLNAGETASGRLPDTPSARSDALLRRLGEAAFRTRFLEPVGTSRSVDTQDGVRIELTAGQTIHFRASGNAPELRCYAEAASATEAETLVDWGLKAAADAIRS